MDFDANLLLNFVPIISTSILTLVACATVFYKLKNRWPIKVNCWFCNGYAKIQRWSLDWWLCPHCNQYNGFSEDGDYNYEIPDQHKITKKISKHKSYCQRKDSSVIQNSLCKECNRKEEFKLSKLRELENSIDVCNDKQLARFERSFEKKYPLCLRCQGIVQTVLHKQRLWLTQYKMLLFKQKPIQRIIKNREKIERMLRIVLSILSSVAIYFTEIWYLPLCGILFQLAVSLLSINGKRQSDIFLILGWLCLIWVRTFSTTTVLKMFKIYINNDWASVDDNTYQYFIISLGTVIGLTNLKCHSYKTVSNEFLTFKKLESPTRNISASCSPTPDTSTLFSEEINSNNKSVRNLYSPVNITDTLLTSTNVETPIPLKPNNVPKWSLEESRTFSQNQFSSKTPNCTFNNEHSFSKGLNNQNHLLNDSVTSLNSLSLGTQHKDSQSHSPKVFETKVYGTTSPDLFNFKQQQQRRSILAPSKLRSVTQTSWVAGGYWQSGIVPTLSRSSSQSSGIGSSGSNCGPSREPSINEFDQFSVASEQCYFARPESPLSTRNSVGFSVVRKTSGCSPKCHQIIHDIACTESMHHVRKETQCSGHTTIVTNPIWIPVLLCGSLIFNMVVLCAILLRS